MEAKNDPAVETKHYFNIYEYNDPYDKKRGAQPFFLGAHHRFYQQFSRSWDASTARFLEYGGGPIVYPLISAAPFFNEITFSDYQQLNLDAVVAWRDSEEGHHDWLPYFKYVLSELEGNDDSEEMALERQDEARAKVRSILLGDLHADKILSLDSDFHEMFDVISSNFCLDAVADTVSDYYINVRHLGELVKPGGFLIGLASLGVTYWYPANGRRNFHITIEEDDVKKAFTDAGFDVVFSDIHHLPESARHIIGDTKANMFVAGQKQG